METTQQNTFTDEDQGQVSAQAEPKDEKQNNYTDDEKQLAEKYLVEPKLVRMISEIVAEHTRDTKGIQQIIDLVRDKQEQRAETEQTDDPQTEVEELKEAASVDSLVSQLTEECRIYNPPFQRDLLELVAKGTPSPPDWKNTRDDKIYAVGKINKIFERLDNSIRQKVIAQYLKDILPAHEARYNQEKEELQACDELLALTEGKTPQQIRDMTISLKELKAGSDDNLQTELLSPADEQPEPEASKDEDFADRAENLVKQWLLQQSYTTKLAFTILNIYFLDDHGTNDLANEIADKYTAEIMAMAEKPDNSLTDTEKFMTGVAAELTVWRNK